MMPSVHVDLRRNLRITVVEARAIMAAIEGHPGCKTAAAKIARAIEVATHTCPMEGPCVVCGSTREQNDRLRQFRADIFKERLTKSDAAQRFTISNARRERLEQPPKLKLTNAAKGGANA